MVKRCPICGGELAGNVCINCCYALPQDKELVAMYNLDPADYPQGIPVREIIPEHICEEIYPNRVNLANRVDLAKNPVAIKVREETAVQPVPKQPSVPMKYNMPYVSQRPVRTVQNTTNAQYYVQNTQEIRSLSELLWDSFENFKENLWKCWTLLPLCYFFPPCILIYFVVAGVRLFSGEKVSIPFGMLTALVTVLGWLGGLQFLL
ncbi:MAG: hypothetical protein K2H23_07665 [Oscillospiraceae bacterium]|nr:hypothetical protein [Oscillospiraceae bacterium]